MTDLEVYQPKAPVAIPANGHQDTDSWITVVRDIIRIADVIYDTPFVPDGLRGSSPAVAAAMLAGREMGLGIMTSLANIDVIRGKPTQKALLMRAMILSRGHKWQDVDVTDSRAVVRGCRKGESEWTEVTFTDANARRAGIDLGKYPADKLYARATSRLARRKFADVIMGMPYSAEEVEDGEADEGTVTERPAIVNGTAKPAAQKARRKTAAAGDDTQGQHPAGTQAARPEDAGDSTAQDATPRAAGAAPSRGAQPLPPLPGEDDETPAAAVPDETPASGPAAAAGPGRHRKLVGIVRAHFKRLGYTDSDDTVRLEHTATLAGTSELGSTNDLDEDELKAVADTLARCKNVDALKTLLDAAGAQKTGDGDE